MLRKRFEKKKISDPSLIKPNSYLLVDLKAILSLYEKVGIIEFKQPLKIRISDLIAEDDTIHNFTKIELVGKYWRLLDEWNNQYLLTKTPSVIQLQLIEIISNPNYKQDKINIYPVN